MYYDKASCSPVAGTGTRHTPVMIWRDEIQPLPFHSQPSLHERVLREKRSEGRRRSCLLSRQGRRTVLRRNVGSPRLTKVQHRHQNPACIGRHTESALAANLQHSPIDHQDIPRDATASLLSRNLNQPAEQLSSDSAVLAPIADYERKLGVAIRSLSGQPCDADALTIGLFGH